VPGCPLIIGANREEYYDRPSQSPRLLHPSPAIWGGRDLRAGGTWLGVNEHGLVAAVTNRPGPPRPESRSRGLLCLETLHASSADEAAQSLETQLRRDHYSPLNCFVGDGVKSFLLAHDDGDAFLWLREGLWLVPNGDLNDPEMPRVRRAQALLVDRSFTGVDDAIRALESVLADHESGVPFRDMICLHGVASGTVSSSILAVWPRRMEQSRYLHLQGKPCEQSYRDYGHLFRDEWDPGSRPH